jgi:hypothetical protein
MSCCASRTELHSQVLLAPAWMGGHKVPHKLSASSGSAGEFSNLSVRLRKSRSRALEFHRATDIPDQVVAQFLFVSFTKQLRDRGLVPLGIVQRPILIPVSP